MYRELLRRPETAERDEQHCLPQILATSKQINNEARGILYENVWDIKIMVDSPSRYKTLPRISITVGNVVRTRGMLPADTLLSAPLPSFLRRMHSLSISIEVAPQNPYTTADDISIVLNKALYCLGDALIESVDLESVILHVKDLQDVALDGLGSILWPIAKLQLPGTAVQVRGLSNE